MFIREKKLPDQKIAIQIVESIRVGKKIKQRIVRHIGKAHHPGEISHFVNLAEIAIKDLRDAKEGWLPGLRSERKKTPEEDRVLVKNLKEESRQVIGIREIFGMLYDELGFDSLLGNDSPYNKVLRECVLGRITDPCSKRKTVARLNRIPGESLPLQKVYRMMDAAHLRQEEIKTAVLRGTVSLFKERVDVLFFDVTTLYFESFKEDTLREFGFSKDCKFKETQVVLALVSTTEGQPITYELFPGSTYEGGTLITMIESLKKRFEVENVVLVADRAMFNEKNLMLMESQEIRYVVAAKLRALNAELKNQILSSVLYKPTAVEDELHWVTSFEYKNKRKLVVSYSSVRAGHDSYKRGQLLERMIEKEQDGTIRVKDLIKNRGATKFLKVTGGIATLDYDKVAEDAKWDGIHGIVTNINNQTSSEILSRYRGLWQIEESFRINKHDLKMRPIYHWTEKRIQAHIAICFLAFALVKQSLLRLKRQDFAISFEALREELLQIQASILIDKKTLKRYRLPSKFSDAQKRIYQALELKFTENVIAL
jgi:transposase